MPDAFHRSEVAVAITMQDDPVHPQPSIERTFVPIVSQKRKSFKRGKYRQKKS
jgi:hypothetical protein